METWLKNKQTIKLTESDDEDEDLLIDFFMRNTAYRMSSISKIHGVYGSEYSTVFSLHLGTVIKDGAVHRYMAKWYWDFEDMVGERVLRKLTNKQLTSPS